MLSTIRRALFLVGLLGFLFPVPIGAWGDAGHRIVALVAADRLSPAVATAAHNLLEGKTLAEVATEADRIRQFRPETKNWHFVDIPKNATDYDPTRDCQPTDNGDCAIAAIERFRTTLADATKPTADRKEALTFLVHLLGDLHQPLHCANNNDRGGNEVKVKWFGKRSNLHAIWDTGIIEEAALTDREFADEIAGGVTAAEVASIQAGTVIDWALEAHKLAKTHAYKISASKLLGPQYYDANADTVDQQLLRAGLRLAKVLNEALAGT